jgi:hypothetical protein
MESGIVPGGTTVSVKSVVRIEAKEAVPAEGFPAVLVGDLRNDAGQVVASSGSPLRLVILDTSPAQLGIAAIMIAGNWRAAQPSSAPADVVGGGAPLGTLVRGVLDTHAGQLAPTESMAIRTSAPDLQVPAGALLVFRLDQPLRIAGMGR